MTETYHIEHYSPDGLGVIRAQRWASVCYQAMAEDIARRSLFDPWFANVYQGNPYCVRVIHEASGGVIWAGRSDAIP